MDISFLIFIIFSIIVFLAAGIALYGEHQDKLDREDRDCNCGD